MPLPTLPRLATTLAPPSCIKEPPAWTPSRCHLPLLAPRLVELRAASSRQQQQRQPRRRQQQQQLQPRRRRRRQQLQPRRRRRRQQLQLGRARTVVGWPRLAAPLSRRGSRGGSLPGLAVAALLQVAAVAPLPEAAVAAPHAPASPTASSRSLPASQPGRIRLDLDPAALIQPDPDPTAQAPGREARMPGQQLRGPRVGLRGRGGRAGKLAWTCSAAPSSTCVTRCTRGRPG